MQIENLTLTNFNGRHFKIHTYTLKKNPKLVRQKRPLMIVIPGGSFDHLSLREGEPVALAYAACGFNSAIMEYNLVQDPGRIYPDAGLDVLATVKYYREHASKYQIDPQQIITIGFSAGGHVASAANFLADSPAFKKKFAYQTAAVKPNATILGYPLINIEQIGFPLPAGAQANLPEEAELLDTAKGVSRKTPPTFVFQAWNDPVVLVTNALEYLAALKKKEVPGCEGHLFSYGYHGFSLAGPQTTEKGREWENNPHAGQWFKLSLQWLQDRFTD